MRDMNPSQFKGVMVLLEHSENEFERVSLETLGKANELAHELKTQVTALVLGYNVASLAKEAVQFGADNVILADSTELARYTTEAYTAVVNEIVVDKRPEIVLIGATHNGRDLAGRLAVRLNTGLTAHAVRVEIEQKSGLLVCGVPGFGGSIVAMCKCPKSRPQMATVSPGVFPVPARDMRRRGSIERVPVKLTGLKTRIVEHSVKQSIDIMKAKVLVIAGRGAEAHLNQVRSFANALGAPIGVTRPLADKELMPREHQVGSTGSAVSPKIAIVLGASGAAHFVSGIRDAEQVISINKDPEANINNYADYFVTDDIESVLTHLISKLELVVGEAR